MPRKRFTDEQIAFALRQADGGTPIGEICRKMGVSEATFYRWKKVYAGMGVAEIRRLKQLEDENGKLKRLVADLSLDKEMLQDALRKSGEAFRAPRRRGLAPPLSASASGGPFKQAASTGRPTVTDQAAIRRPLCGRGSRSWPRRVCAAAIGVFTCCFDGRAGRSTTSGLTGSTARKGCPFGPGPRVGGVLADIDPAARKSEG